MNLYHDDLYMEDVRYVAGLDLPWHKLQGKSIMLSGATGLIGSFFIDVIFERNNIDELNCTIYALGRNEKRAYERFSKYRDDSRFVFIPYDVNLPFTNNEMGTVDYILHLAANTNPVLYATDPIGTITTNLFGLQNLLDFAVNHHTKRFVFASSNEIYGENRGDVELFDEEYCGYINCNTLRAGYPESKRCGEALCQAYKVQKNIDVIVARFTRTYGPTMLSNDSKAINQFIRKGLEGKDIVLKSTGTQYYSFLYVADAVSGVLTAMFWGENGEAYNISDEKSDITLRDLATIIARMSGKKVVFEIPDAIEAAGFSRTTKARLNGKKLQGLGWKAKYDIHSGLKRTLQIFKTQNS